MSAVNTCIPVNTVNTVQKPRADQRGAGISAAVPSAGSPASSTSKINNHHSAIINPWLEKLGGQSPGIQVSVPGSFDSIPRLRNAVPVLVFVLTFLSIGVAVVDNGTIFCYTCAFEAGYIPL